MTVYLVIGMIMLIVFICTAGLFVACFKYLRVLKRAVNIPSLG